MSKYETDRNLILETLKNNHRGLMVTEIAIKASMAVEDVRYILKCLVLDDLVSNTLYAGLGYNVYEIT